MNTLAIADKLMQARQIEASAGDVGPLLQQACRCWEKLAAGQYSSRPEAQALATGCLQKLTGALMALSQIEKVRMEEHGNGFHPVGHTGEPGDQEVKDG
jgi:hypothetical protein